MDFLKKEYPTISNLYFSYINGEEYRQLKTTKYINKVIAKATEKAQTELSDNIANACDEQMTLLLLAKLNDNILVNGLTKENLQDLSAFQVDLLLIIRKFAKII